SRGVVVLIRLDRGEAVYLGLRRTAADRDRVALDVRRSDRARTRREQIARLGEGPHAIRIRIRELCGDEQIARLHRNVTVRTTGNQDAVVVGQQNSRVTATREAERGRRRFENL